MAIKTIVIEMITRRLLGAYYTQTHHHTVNWTIPATIMISNVKRNNEKRVGTLQLIQERRSGASSRPSISLWKKYPNWLLLFYQLKK